MTIRSGGRPIGWPLDWIVISFGMDVSISIFQVDRSNDGPIGRQSDW
ncbi:hypothetical protein HanIR_Chr04g0179861 [Helianthus annuus]|nr:hypothetical protein HanIR_Chr04g0179861 [Helianthus annuus]